VRRPLPARTDRTGHVITSHPALRRLSGLLTPELLHNLTAEPHLTIFAPVDAAWDALDELEWRYLQSGYADQDTDELVGRHASENATAAYAYRLLRTGSIDVLSGARLGIEAGHGSVPFVVNGSAVVERDILASNGVLHIVSDLLLPAGSLQLNAEKYLLALNATRFVGLLRSANLSSYVQAQDRPYTILAPRDDVLDSTLTRSSTLPREGTLEMEELLRYHVLDGRWTPDRLADGQLLGTVLRPRGLAGAAQLMPVTVASADVRALGLPQGNGDIAFGDANVIAEPSAS